MRCPTNRAAAPNNGRLSRAPSPSPKARAWHGWTGMRKNLSGESGLTENPHMTPFAQPWLVHARLNLSFLQPVAMAMGLSPALRPDAPVRHHHLGDWCHMRVLTTLLYVVFLGLAGCMSGRPAPVEEREIDARVRTPARQDSAGVQVFPLQNPAVVQLTEEAQRAEHAGDLDQGGRAVGACAAHPSRGTRKSCSRWRKCSYKRKITIKL